MTHYVGEPTAGVSCRYKDGHRGKCTPLKPKPCTYTQADLDRIVAEKLAGMRVQFREAVERGIHKWATEGMCHERSCGCATELVRDEMDSIPDSAADAGVRSIKSRVLEKAAAVCRKFGAYMRDEAGAGDIGVILDKTADDILALKEQPL